MKLNRLANLDISIIYKKYCNTWMSFYMKKVDLVGSTDIL